MASLTTTKTWANGESVTPNKLNQWAGGMALGAGSIVRADCLDADAPVTTDLAYNTKDGQLLYDSGTAKLNLVQDFPDGAVYSLEPLYRRFPGLQLCGWSGKHATGAAKIGVSCAGPDLVNNLAQYVNGAAGMGPHFVTETGGTNHVELATGGIVLWPRTLLDAGVVAGDQLYLTAGGLLATTPGTIGNQYPVALAWESAGGAGGNRYIYAFVCGGLL